MGGRYKLVFGGALLVAAVATFGAYRLLNANSRSEVTTRPVVVASRDIPEGSTIDRIALATKDWPVQTVPVGAFASIDSVAGRVAQVAVYNGEAIVPGRLAPVGTGPGLELKIPPGQRAMAVRMDICRSCRVRSCTPPMSGSMPSVACSLLAAAWAWASDW